MSMETSAKTILIVDDDVKIVELVKLYLQHDGYRTITAYDGNQALEMASGGHPDLIILDLMLPGRDGLDVCRTLRRESDIPIIMITARTTEQDKLTGLDLGADDYVSKPFSPKELVARVKAVLRRLPDEKHMRGPTEIQQGEISLNFIRQEASKAGQSISLTPVEFRLLSTLIREPERVFNREQLIERLFGYDFDGMSRTIDVHILNLRRKIEPDPNHPTIIRTVYGMGYKFVRSNQP